MSDNSRPMDYGEAVWRTAEIRMKLNDMRAQLEEMPPFARHFALQSIIAKTEEELKDAEPEFKNAILRMYRSWGKM